MVRTSPAAPQPNDINNLVHLEGFAFLKRWKSDELSEYVVCSLGRGLTFGKDKCIHQIVPRTGNAPNTYSGIYGLNEFPLHSDMAHWPEPPRYMMLRCVVGNPAVTTSIVDGKQIIRTAGAECLARGLVRPRRPRHGKFPLLSIYTPKPSNNFGMLRWDEKFIVPASSAGHEAMTAVRGALNSIVRHSIALTDAGDTLIIDNWRMLHGRSAAPANSTNRIIERAYLGDLH